MNLDLLIGELLMRNNCVVIPKFGGFIATQAEAQIDFSKGVMSAPKKAILFNKQLTNSDGLLISAYALKNKLDYEFASQEIDKQIKNWQKELSGGKRISFDKVGFLYLDNQKNILFEQDRFFNLLMQSFGMGQVTFVSDQNIEVKESTTPKIESKEVIGENSVEIEKENETPIIQLLPNFIKKKESKKATKNSEIKKIISTAHKQKSNKKLIKYIAAACILPIAFYSVWIPTKTDVLESGMISLKDFNPFKKSVKSIYTSKNFSTKLEQFPKEKTLNEQISALPSDISIYSMEIDDEVFFVKVKDTEPIQKNSQTNLPNKETITIPKEYVSKAISSATSKGNLQIIVGSFSNQNNAAELASSLRAKGFDAYTFEQENGLIRVSAGKAENSMDAQILVQKLSENQVSAWILK